MMVACYRLEMPTDGLPRIPLQGVQGTTIMAWLLALTKCRWGWGDSDARTLSYRNVDYSFVVGRGVFQALDGCSILGCCCCVRFDILEASSYGRQMSEIAHIV